MILRSPANLFMLVGTHTSLRADGREAQSRLRGPAMGTKWHWKTAFKKYCPHLIFLCFSPVSLQMQVSSCCFTQGSKPCAVARVTSGFLLPSEEEMHA